MVNLTAMKDVKILNYLLNSMTTNVKKYMYTKISIKNL